MAVCIVDYHRLIMRCVSWMQGILLSSLWSLSGKRRFFFFGKCPMHSTAAHPSLNPASIFFVVATGLFPYPYCPGSIFCHSHLHLPISLLPGFTTICGRTSSSSLGWDPLKWRAGTLPPWWDFSGRAIRASCLSFSTVMCCAAFCTCSRPSTFNQAVCFFFFIRVVILLDKMILKIWWAPSICLVYQSWCLYSSSKPLGKLLGLFSH